MPTEVERLLVRVEATQAKFEKQMRNMARTAKRSAQSSENAWTAANNNIAARTNRSVGAFRRLSKVTGNTRFALQNTANQLQDITVQIQGGTSAARALSQQIPQIGIAFGPIGAGLGLIAGLAIPVIASLGGAGDATGQLAARAKEADAAISNLSSAVSAYKTAANDAKTEAKDLAKAYGLTTAEARKLLNVQRDIAQRGAILELSVTADALSDQFGDIRGATLEQLRNLQRDIALESQQFGLTTPDPFGNTQASFFREQQAAIEALASGLKLSEEGALRVGAALGELGRAQQQIADAKTFEEQRAAAEQVVQALQRTQTELIAAAGGIDRMTSSQLAFNEKLQTAIKSGSELVGTMNALPGVIDQSSNAASRLTGELDAAANAAAGIISNLDKSIARQQILLRTVGDTVARKRELALAEFDAKTSTVTGAVDRQLANRIAGEREIVKAKTEQLAKLEEQVRKEEQAARKTSRPSGGRTRRTAGGGGGRAARATSTLAGSALNFGQGFAGVTAQIQQQTAAIQNVLGAMGQLGVSLDQNAVAAEATRLQFQLLAAAQREGIAITPELKERIEALSNAYAQAKVASEQLTGSTTRVTQSVNEFGSFAPDIIKGFISDLRNSRSAAEALSNALAKIGDRLLDIGLNAAFSGLGGGGGFLGALFGFAGGGQVRGFRRGGLLDGRGSGTSDSNVGVGPRGPMKFSRGEYLVRAASVTPQTMPILDAINKGDFRRMVAGGVTDGMGGGGANVTTGDTKIVNAIDGPSFLAEALAQRTGERILLNHVRARPRAFREALGV